MKVFKVKSNKVYEVECDILKYPELDSEGDTIFENTHFESAEKAYKRAISNCESGVSLLTIDLEQTRKKEENILKLLGDECIALENLKREFRRLELLTD